MGFNKCYIPTKKELEDYLAEHGVEKFLSRFAKCDALIGDSDAIEFLKEVEKNHIYNKL